MNTICPKCGNPKQPWFKLCFSCNEKEKQKPTCEICGIEVPERHYLCKTHFLEKLQEKKKLNQIEFVKTKKQEDYKKKFEGKYYFNSMKIKSKSELIICYFLNANGVIFSYEPEMNIENELFRPDFVIEDKKGNTVILEHNGMEDETSKERYDKKKKIYEKFCRENKDYYYIFTDEDYIYDLKDKLGKELNKTPLAKPLWK